MSAITLRDAYDMGCTVARHPHCQSARDRAREVEALVDGLARRGRTDRADAMQAAYQLGRDRAWRMGE